MPTLTASTAACSPRCAPFACRRGTTRTRGLPAGPAPAPAPAHGQGCARPLGRAAGVVGGGIASAFFVSLERFSCVEVRTKEDDDAEAAPLMRSTAGHSPTAATSTSGRRRAAASGKGKRRGLGCCENSAIN